MKKILAMILAMLLALSMVAVLAADQYTDASTATFTVNYTATNGGTQPEETFTFSDFVFVKVENAGVDPETGETVIKGPSITKIPDITLNSTTTSGTATITLPALTEFKAVGAYSYTFSQNVGSTAGVTYYKNDAKQDMRLVITVVEDESGKKRIAAVHVENKDTGDKTGKIDNTYESGTLDVTKKVTGNLGDKNKYFDVVVTFTPAEGETIKSVITYAGGKYSEPVTVANNTATIQVKHGDTVTFSNIPEGTTYVVAETTPDDYEATYENEGEKDGEGAIAAGNEDTVTITNTKETEPDTGITLESLPYVLVLGIALAGVALMIIRRRRNED